MEKEFVPYELALRMKQLGFNERCFKYEDAKKICENNAHPGGCQLPNVHCGYPNCTIDRSVEPLAIPIYQQAFRWFRDKLKDSALEPYDMVKQYAYNMKVSWEEAELACLKKLIEIVEQKEKV
jgi:hypothetical protein